MFAVHTRKFTDLTDNSETMSKDRGEVCGEETLERFSDQGENTLRIKHAENRKNNNRLVSLHVITRRSYGTSRM